ITLTLVFGILILSKGQTKTDLPSAVPSWTETDRKYLLDNLIRSKQELIDETKNLTKKQWNFKESPDRINQIVEHIDLYELIFMHEISVALQSEPIPSFQHNMSDSLFLDQDPKSLRKNNTMDFTKPFSISVPLGNNEGKNNMTWLTTIRDESIEYVKNATQNIRLHYICFGPNVHQKYMMIFTHTDRHLRQLRKVKAHPNYPK
ncbi:MAG: hypothetical protein JJE09_05420, partial [Bacteroidia bacterium]|nr:hypothetical protein [Bacteroidia bacterium]